MKLCIEDRFITMDAEFGKTEGSIQKHTAVSLESSLED